MGANIVQHADMRMLELRDRPRLTLEPPLQLSVRVQIFGDDFYRDGSFQPRVPSAIHLSHSTGAQWRDDLVGAQSCPRGEGHFRVRAIIASNTAFQRIPTILDGLSATRKLTWAELIPCCP